MRRKAKTSDRLERQPLIIMAGILWFLGGFIVGVIATIIVIWIMKTEVGGW